MHDALVGELAANAAFLADVAERTSSDALERRPSPDEWSIAEIIGHVRAADAIWVPRILVGVLHDGAPMPDVDERALQDLTSTGSLSLRDEVTSFALGRRQLVGVLRSLDDGQWSSTCRHATRGELAVIDCADMLLRHEREHVTEVYRLATSLTESFEPG